MLFLHINRQGLSPLVAFEQLQIAEMATIRAHLRRRTDTLPHFSLRKDVSGTVLHRRALWHQVMAIIRDMITSSQM